MSIAVIKLNYYIFLGGVEAATCQQFVLANKITHIVNCSGAHVTNQFALNGVQYLTFFLLDQDSGMFFDNAVANAANLCAFMDQAQDNCNSVLIHSVHGNSRSLLVAAVYLMSKYHWKASDAIAAVSSCRRARMRPYFEDQLRLYELSLPPFKLTPTLVEEDITLRNTFFNKDLRLVVSPDIPETNVKINLSTRGYEILEGSQTKLRPLNTKPLFIKESILKHPRKKKVFNPVKDQQQLEKEMMKLYLPLSSAQPAYLRVSQSYLLSAKINATCQQTKKGADDAFAANAIASGFVNSDDNQKTSKTQGNIAFNLNVSTLNSNKNQQMNQNTRITVNSCAISTSAPGIGYPIKAPQMEIPMMEIFQSCQSRSDVEWMCFLQESNYWNTTQLDATNQSNTDEQDPEQQIQSLYDVDDDSNSDNEMQLLPFSSLKSRSSTPQTYSQVEKSKSPSAFQVIQSRQIVPSEGQLSSQRAIHRLNHKAGRIFRKLKMQRQMLVAQGQNSNSSSSEQQQDTSSSSSSQQQDTSSSSSSQQQQSSNSSSSSSSSSFQLTQHDIEYVSWEQHNIHKQEKNKAKEQVIHELSPVNIKQTQFPIKSITPKPKGTPLSPSLLDKGQTPITNSRSLKQTLNLKLINNNNNNNSFQSPTVTNGIAIPLISPGLEDVQQIMQPLSQPIPQMPSVVISPNPQEQNILQIASPQQFTSLLPVLQVLETSSNQQQNATSTSEKIQQSESLNQNQNQNKTVKLQPQNSFTSNQTSSFSRFISQNQSKNKLPVPQRKQIQFKQWSKPSFQSLTSNTKNYQIGKSVSFQKQTNQTALSPSELKTQIKSPVTDESIKQTDGDLSLISPQFTPDNMTSPNQTNNQSQLFPDSNITPQASLNDENSKINKDILQQLSFSPIQTSDQQQQEDSIQDNEDLKISDTQDLEMPPQEPPVQISTEFGQLICNGYEDIEDGDSTFDNKQNDSQNEAELEKNEESYSSIQNVNQSSSNSYSSIQQNSEKNNNNTNNNNTTTNNNNSNQQHTPLSHRQIIKSQSNIQPKSKAKLSQTQQVPKKQQQQQQTKSPKQTNQHLVRSAASPIRKHTDSFSQRSPQHSNSNIINSKTPNNNNKTNQSISQNKSPTIQIKRTQSNELNSPNAAQLQIQQIKSPAQLNNSDTDFSPQQSSQPLIAAVKSPAPNANINNNATNNNKSPLQNNNNNKISSNSLGYTQKSPSIQQAKITKRIQKKS